MHLPSTTRIILIKSKDLHDILLRIYIFQYFLSIILLPTPHLHSKIHSIRKSGIGMKRLHLTLILISSALLFSACVSSSNSPAIAVEKYLQAMVDRNIVEMKANTCSSWEENAQTDFDSFQGLDARTENLSCTVISQSDEYAEVACTGNIIVTYNGEDAPFALDVRNYLSSKTDGRWEFCGYP